uniref:Spindle and kinetochore-associated protein 1-like protein n=1 Tax=Triticum urartu TaxID=4572 RepID=A0A8R7PD00_TRIUA
MEAAAAAAAIPGSSSLEAVATAFRSRVNELQDLALARNMYPATAVTDLTAVDTSVTAMEAQVQAIRRRLQEELDAIPKAKKLVEKSLKQQQKLQHMLANMPPGMREDIVATPLEQSLMLPECFNFNTAVPEFLDSDFKIKEEPVAAPKVNIYLCVAPFTDLSYNCFSRSFFFFVLTYNVLPSLFHQIGLLVALARACTSTWYQSQEVLSSRPGWRN